MQFDAHMAIGLQFRKIGGAPPRRGPANETPKDAIAAMHAELTIYPLAFAERRRRGYFRYVAEFKILR